MGTRGAGSGVYTGRQPRYSVPETRPGMNVARRAGLVPFQRPLAYLLPATYYDCSVDSDTLRNIVTTQLPQPSSVPL